MIGNLQKGIYYRKDQAIGNSFCITFLRFNKNANPADIGVILTSIWSNLQDLEKGIVKDLDVNIRKRSSGNLTALIGYSLNVFFLNKIKRKKPIVFDEKWNFHKPLSKGGGPVIEGSEIFYSSDLIENPLAEDHIVIQFIADTDFHTNRALVELWRELNTQNKEIIQRTNLHISNYYTGFHSPTGRSLIGFLDGLSNIKNNQRYDSIAIKQSNSPDDFWTANGTYLSFMRITFDLNAWESLKVEQQEIMIGRDKETGCPILGIDKMGKPIKDRGCPVFGTYDVTDTGNERFRIHPEYGNQHLTIETSDKPLLKSHIYRSNPIRSILSRESSVKIFRQGFQFIEANDFLSRSNIGLNFVCFQNSTENLFRILTYEKGNENSQVGTVNLSPNFQNFFSVRCAGNFFVPPITKGETFPGSSIFS